MPITISLIAPPLYVMTTNALQESEGIALLTRAIEKLNETIKDYGGNLVVKNQVRIEGWFVIVASCSSEARGR